MLIDLSKNSILIRDPMRERNLKRKEVIGSYSERMKLIVDGSTVLKPKEITLCRLKLTGAAAHFKNDRQLCVLPIKDVRNESSCVSAGRTLTLTKDGRVAVPMLNPTDKELVMRSGQKVAYALPAFTELIDTIEKLRDCLGERCKACNAKHKSSTLHVKSVCSSQESMQSTPSGRSNFPAKADMDKVDLLPDLEGLTDRISPEQLKRLKAVLESKAAVFAKNKADIWCCKMVDHRIDLEDGAVPHYEGASRMALLKAKKANEEVRHLLILDSIEPSYSPRACGVATAKKKGNQLRFCCDFRFLNAKTMRDAYPLPRIDESIARLGCAIYCTTLDLGSALWQVPLREEDRPKTAFACELGLYQWQVMPFGLSNATATFQRLMSRVLMDVAQSYGHLVMCYVDDVIIATGTIDEHIDRIDEVLPWLREAGLECKPSKCEFLKCSNKYLGRVFDKEGVRPDPESVETVMQWRRPRNKRELQSFLGFANY